MNLKKPATRATHAQAAKKNKNPPTLAATRKSSQPPTAILPASTGDTFFPRANEPIVVTAMTRPNISSICNPLIYSNLRSLFVSAQSAFGWTKEVNGMRTSKLRLLTIAVSLCFTIGLVTPALGQQVTSQGKSGWVNPYKELDKAARLVKNSNDEQSIRGVADAVFGFPRALPRSPEMIENVIKDRLVRAEIAYRSGIHEGVQEQDIVKFANSVADHLALPSYAKTSAQQVRVLRMQLALSSPTFMAAGLTHENMKVGESISDRMSPLQAVHLLSSLLDQKIINPEYQLEPAEWERVHLASATAKIQQMQKLQSSDQHANAPNKAEVRVFHRRRDLHQAILQAGSSLSFTDTMNLIDQAFATLKIDR
jgi:hypothetical protein